MKLLLTILVVVLGALLFPSKVDAIIILPAVILIPLAQLVAVIVAAFGIPVVSVGVFIKTISKDNKLAILVSLLIIAVIIVISVVVLKTKYPDNPWF